jgi:hypothetical protein
MSPAAKWEYMKEVYPRYHQATRAEKKRILDEFCEIYRCHRKHAIRVLNGPIPSPQRPKRRGRRTYKDDVLSILQAVWEAAGYPWSIRLKALLRIWLPWIRPRFRLTPAQESQLLRISPAQIDRRLAHVKRRLRKRIYGKTKPGTLLKHHIPIKTDCWDVDRPGYLEIDLVSHSGDNAEGLFAQTLDTTDIHTAWTEAVAIMGKSQEAVCNAMDIIDEAFPFKILGLDSDNGSEFINDHLWRRCQDRQIQFTRGRPYKKDDNAHIEQKNWTHVRKLLGYVRYDTQDVLDAMNDLYRNELRWFQNFFQPCVKLKKKVRVGSKLTRRYDKPQTPWQRVLASPQRDPDKVATLQALFKTLNPFELAKTIDQKLAAIYRMSSTLKRQGSRPLPKILPAQKPKPNAAFNALQPAHPHSVPESTVTYNWTNDRDDLLARFRKSHAKEKFLAAS